MFFVKNHRFSQVFAISMKTRMNRVKEALRMQVPIGDTAFCGIMILARAQKIAKKENKKHWGYKCRRKQKTALQVLPLFPGQIPLLAIFFREQADGVCAGGAEQQPETGYIGTMFGRR